MTQYTDYGTVPQAVRDIVANKVKLLDEYIVCQTGQNEYTGLIRDMVTGKVTSIVVSRANSYNVYNVRVSEGSWDYSISNEYYCYSNIGYGASLDLPVYDGIVAHCNTVLVCVLMFAIMFKGVLFTCLKRKR